MIVLVGSSALKELGFNYREPNDIDLIGDYDDLVTYLKAAGCGYIVPEGKKLIGKANGERGTTIYDCEVVWGEHSLGNLILNYVKENPEPNSVVIQSHGCEVYVAGLNILLALKMEHRFLKNSPHFLKTMRDIRWLRSEGANTSEKLNKIIAKRQKAVLSYNHPKLNVDKGDFFNGDGVEYVYDHDTIHQAVKIFDQPAYTYFKPEDNEVLCDKEMFFAQRREIQLAATYEEACVLALERSQIPHPHTNVRDSFLLALEKVCTSITSGWFRAFSWENYPQVLEIYDYQTSIGQNYLDCFKRGVENGVVKKN